MSRCQPNKPKPRSAKRTVLVVGEGATEKAFLGHLKGLFLQRSAGFTVKVESADGGSPEGIIKRAAALLRGVKYDRCVIVMDTDLPWPFPVPPRLAGVPVDYVRETPCVEAILLEVAGHPRPTTTASAKSQFHHLLIPENRKTGADAYGKDFPQTLLQTRRSAVPELNRMIRIMETGT